MSTEEIDHSTPAMHSFAQAAESSEHGFWARRASWPHGSVMIRRGATGNTPATMGTLYVIGPQGLVVHLTDADRAAKDWTICDPSYMPVPLID